MKPPSFDLVSQLPADAGVITGPYLYVQPSATSIEHLDPVSGKILAAYRLPPDASPVLTTTASLWIAAGRQIIQLDASTLVLQRTYPAAGVVSSLAVAGHYLWSTASADPNQSSEQHLYRQALTGGPPQTIPINGTVKDVYANQSGNELALTQTTNILCVDPATGAVLHVYRFAESMNTVIGGIAGSIAWIIEGGGHYNTLTGFDLRTGNSIPITGIAPTSLVYDGQLRVTGNSVVQTSQGDGTSSCIDPTTGQTRVTFLLPRSMLLLGIVNGQLITENRQYAAHDELLRTTVPGCP